MKVRLIFALYSLFSILSYADNSPKYIFYFIGDGMGLGHIASADTYYRSVETDSIPLLMLQFPIMTTCSTYSASSPVTDSSAAGTALACGTKTKNYMLGMNADSIPVESIAKYLHDIGYGVGIITNVCPDDATPGAFFAHVPNRNMFYEIGCQAAKSDYEFIAGSRWRGTQNSNLMDLMSQNGMQTIYGLENIDNINSRKVVVLNKDTINNNSGYAIDNLSNSEFSLPRLTAECINHLNKYTPEKFFIMVEGGNIDWAAHANDGGTTIKEIINFNRAISEAYEFYLKNPDKTLIIVTADHDTGGMSLGNNSTGCNANMEYVQYLRTSKDRFSEYCKNLLDSNKTYSWNEMKSFLSEYLGFWARIPISADDESMLESSFSKNFSSRDGKDQETLYKSYNEFAVNVYSIIDKICGFGWTSKTHTGNPVGLYSIGCKSDRFKTVKDNTNIPMLIKESVVGS